MNVIKSRAVASAIDAGPSRPGDTIGSRGWIARARAFIPIGLVGVAAVAVLVGVAAPIAAPGWLGAGLLPLLLPVLSCAAMMWLCRKTMNHGGQGGVGESGDSRHDVK